MLKNLQTELQSFGKYVVQQSRSNLTKQKHNVSKDLYNSIHYIYDTKINEIINTLENNENLVKNINDNKFIALIKIINKRIDIIFHNPEIKLSITQNNKFISEILIGGIIENYKINK